MLSGRLPLRPLMPALGLVLLAGLSWATPTAAVTRVPAFRDDSGRHGTGGTRGTDGDATPDGESGERQKKEDDKKEGLPLKPTRSIEFATTEATWLSLDVAPDGSMLVLEILGDLYTLPIDGGDAVPLTSGMAFDSQPRYSPDGKRIAFISDRDGAENLWIMHADGTGPKKLSRDEGAEFASPAWTPDGSYVAVSRNAQGLGTFEIWMYHVEGGSGVRITTSADSPKTPRNRRVNTLGPEFSPDGHFLYYARKMGGFQYNATFPMWQIARRDLVHGNEDILTQAVGSAIRPVLSPDGSRLVYGTRRDAETGLRLRDMESGEDRWLTWPVQRDDQESRFTRDLLPGYAFTPDGKDLILSYGGGIHRMDVTTGESRPIPFKADIHQDLGPRLHFPARVDTGPVRARLIQKPVASPDGARVAFSTLARIYVADLAEAQPRPVSADEQKAFEPAWSPDGRWLAYVTWSAGEGHIWKIRASGRGRPERLTRVPAFYSDPVFTPDGSEIVALRGMAHERVAEPVDRRQLPGMDLVAIPAAGGDARLIIPARGRGRPHFGPEPDRVYLYSDAGLVSVRLDGSDRLEHLKVVGSPRLGAPEPQPADDIRISPAGDWALAHTSNQLYLVALPPVAHDVPTVNVNSPSLPAARLTAVGADDFGWADGGSTITWSIGSTFYRRPRSSVTFESRKESGDDDKETPGEGAARSLFAPGAAGDDGTKSPADDAEDTPEETTPFPEEDPAVESFSMALEFPRSVPEADIVLRGGRVITMRGDEVLDNADVVIHNNRVVAVGRQSNVTVPDGARIVDVRGMTLVPGFIDTHAHWTEIRRGILDLQNWSFLANLAYGVTAGLDVQTGTNDMFAYQDMVDTGEILGPRAFSTGPGIFSNNAFKSKEAAAGVIARYKNHYRNRHLKSYVVGTREQRQFVVQAARDLEMMPTTEGALDMKIDLTHALDGFNGNEHALPIVPLFRDVVELYARSGIGYTPTLLVAYGGPWAENYFYTSTEVHDDAKLNRFMPHNLIDAKTRRRPWFRRDEQVFPRLAAQAAKIVRAGGHVGIGGHGQLQGLGYHWEMWALASGGLTPHQVLRAATLHGADMIGYDADLGSIEPGKLADLVVLAKNPLDDIHNTNTVRYVVKNGELFDGETLDRIWPDPRPLPPLWWWNDDPAGGAGHH
ncbi:MAG: amidohydrolase family protein [Acidobacteriota bacterium]